MFISTMYNESMKRLISIICLAFQSLLSFAWTVSGRVTDMDNNPLPSASIEILGTNEGTIADANGRFEINISSDTAVVLSISMISYETIQLKVSEGTLYQKIRLKEESKVFDDFVTVGQRKQNNTVTLIDVSQMRHAPSATGGGIEQLVHGNSGVVATNELSSQYSVRGGSYEENAVYVNDIEIYRPQLVRSAQQEGLSFVNLDMVDQVSFSSGGFSSEYGDKMSSVLSIKYKTPNRPFEATLMGSFLGASAYIGSTTGKFSQMHGFRYKNSAYLFDSLDERGDYNTSFIDYQTYLTFKANPKFEISVLGNIATNNYNFYPEDRKTDFGTAFNTKTFQINFEGGEEDKYNSFFGNMSFKIKPNKRTTISFLTTAYNSDENVTYDITGAYWLSDAMDEKMNRDHEKGIASYQEHARDNLNTTILSLGHIGEFKLEKNTIKWGVSAQKETMKDKVQEWEKRDSAGYSVPMRNDVMSLYSNLFSNSKIEAVRTSAFLQNTLVGQTKKGNLIFTAGIRFNYWNFNNEMLVSPRASLAFFPEKAPKWGFRMAVGRYFQSPFYKEIRDTVIQSNGNVEVTLNENIKAPRSNQIVLSADRYFSLWKRPFKFTTEIFGKYIDRLIPYSVDNVKIVYEGINNGDGYVIGGDMKLFGEFVPGVDSWINLSLMNAKENIYGDGAGYLRTPNARAYNISCFFQDQFPNIDQLKMNLKFNFADGFTYGPPKSERKNAIYKSKSYKRVDIGLTYGLERGRDKIMQKSFFKPFRAMSLSLDCLNLFDIPNRCSYDWVSDPSGAQYAVPNNLTRRQLNVKLLLDF